MDTTTERASGKVRRSFLEVQSTTSWCLMRKEDSADQTSASHTPNEQERPEDGLRQGAEAPEGWEDSLGGGRKMTSGVALIKRKPLLSLTTCFKLYCDISWERRWCACNRLYHPKASDITDMAHHPSVLSRWQDIWNWSQLICTKKKKPHLSFMFYKMIYYIMISFLFLYIYNV